ncbi:MAG TPA: EAL domain-containing protein [Gallionella sp.]|nr:EAL domain-containing protein [Gallionella sp.]
MAVMQKTKVNYLVTLPGMLTFLLGSVVMFGWEFGLPALTQIYPHWKPMVPATALCFMLGGLSLLASKGAATGTVSLVQKIFVWLLLLLAGARMVELATGHVFGIEFLLPGLGIHDDQFGHMSPLTAAGFLAFGIGMLFIRRAGSRNARIFSGIMAGALLGVGLVTVIGYWLNFQLVFEGLYTRTGLLWMAFHTAIGMFLLGLGLLCLTLRCRISSVVDPIAKKSAQIYRTTLLVLAATAATTGLVGISYLENTVTQETSSSLSQILDARVAYLDNNLENRLQRAVVAGLEPELTKAATAVLRNPGNRPALAELTHVAAPLLTHGFTGIGLDSGGRHIAITGRMVDKTVLFARLNKGVDTALAWDNGYILRVRIPLADTARSVPPDAFLVFEQALPHLDGMMSESNHFGQTGTMPMCARLDAQRLLCFPQREQAGIYVVPDTFAGNPIPMHYALAGQNGVANLIDYRGRNVLSAYGPVANTGLGLVLRMDLSEVLAPIRNELMYALPLIVILVVLGLVMIRSRVRPLIDNITSAYAAENTVKERFDAAMQSSPDGFVIYSSVKNPAGNIVDFRCEYLNQRAGQMARFAAKSLPENLAVNLVGHTFLEIFPERADMYEKFRTVALTGQMQSEEMSLPGKGGTAQWYLRQVVPMHQGIAVTYRDITQEKLLLQQLQQSNQLRTAIVEGAAYSIISTDVNGTILSFNDAAERMLWYRADELIGKATPAIIHVAEEIRERAESLSQELGRDVEPGFEVFVAKARLNIAEEREWTYVRKDGSRFPVLLSVTALRDENNNFSGFLGIAYDISERKRNDEYIRHIALHDVLTGLPNRALLDDRVLSAIEQQRRNSTPFALAMMDIDRFKHINDTMGHHIGDLILKEFVERVKTCLRPTDTLARMGGDEFVLLLTESEESGAGIVVERIQAALAPPISVGVQAVHVTTSIGISLSPRDGDDMNELMRRADVAMYWVKENGRNGYRAFSPSMDSGGADRLILERDLHIALDNGGFTLFYQPKVNLQTGIISGVEALIRMCREDGQFVSPADFIPLAEDIGLIVPIGLWVLETACRDAVRLQELPGAGLNIAVNISPRQFMNGNLVGAINAVLDRTRLDASLLELEITEGVLMDERNNVATALSELHALGVKIAIDDFGTGYSSLSYLKRFPIGTLKIDQSFVRDMASDTGDAHLVNAIIAMGHSLNIPVVAEGIETAEQLALLRANNCDLGQGFHIGRPMPFDALLEWFAQDNRWKLDKVQS